MRQTWLLALYPARWRARYGEEFRALLEEEEPSPTILVDIIRGAIAAHRSPLPDGGIPMHRSRTPAIASLFAVLLVLPAFTFLTVAAVRTMQPTMYEPAHTAAAIFDAFAALPHGWYWIVLGAAPLVACALALLVAWRRLASHPEAREDLGALVAGLRRIARQPTLVTATVAFVVSALVLAFVVVHGFAG